MTAMKHLLKNFRKFLLSEGDVKYTGILKLMPDANVVASIHLLSQNLPKETETSWQEEPLPVIPLPEDKWHVTLVHQRYLNPYKKQLKEMPLPNPPEIILSAEIEERVSDEGGGRKSWAVFLENQDQMRHYVNTVMKELGAPLDPEPSRRFHISIANLTGRPGDSIS